jgi:opacity protein-like surface antigen
MLALTPAVGSAQDDKRIHVNIGGGPTFMGGDLGSKFQTGWGPAIGVTLDGPNKKLGFQFEYAYRYFNVGDELPINVTKFSANQQTHQLDFNVVANFAKPGSPVRPYAVAGPGAYYRKVEITEYVGSGVICDPWYYVCGTYPVSAVLGSRGGWDFGFNIGGGVGFKVGESAEFFIETRYHYVAGPEIVAATPLPSSTATDAASGTSSNGHYWPLTFGFRF